MANIIFFNRDFTGSIPLNIDIDVERYSISQIGGCDKATLKTPVTADKWELIKLLRCPVEVYGEDGGIKWWGYVNRVIIPHGKLRVGLGLSGLYNKVDVAYTDGTATSSDTQSVAEFGTKEFYINLSNATQTEGENYRDTYLANHQYAVPEIELSGGNEEIVIECNGWWQTLGWKYYTQADTGAVENTTQITDMVTSCGQFLNGVVIENTSGLTSVPTRDGTGTALNYIIELLNAGSSNARPMLAYVDSRRYLHVYERPAERTDFIMRDDGKLETVLGKLVEPENCLAAIWVKLKGTPDVLGGVNVLRPFFIERAEYVEQDESDYLGAY